VPGPWIDLTLPMTADLPVYTAPGYSDPPFDAAPWCGIAEHGFEVWRLSLGTQTGTHVDAPSHFVPGGATLDALAAGDLIGRYFHVDSARLADEGDCRLAGYAGEPILFVDASAAVEVAGPLVAALLGLPCRVWIVAGGLAVRGRDPLYAHRALAAAGRFLVEDLDPAALPRCRCAARRSRFRCASRG
jgi:kynurenine formamidase